MSLFDLRNVIVEPTRVAADSSTLIDPVIVYDASIVLDSGTLDVDDFVSDHKATYISFQINTNLSTSYYRDIWNYKNTDFTKLNNLISSYNWDIINENQSFDQNCSTHRSSRYNKRRKVFQTRI